MPGHTFQDNFDYVSSYLRAEGADPNRSLIRLLFNQALHIISRETRFYTRIWDNSPDAGALEVSGNTVVLPADVLRVDSVEYGGSNIPLVKRTAAYMDEYCPGWRSQLGEPVDYVEEPSKIVLGSIPRSDTCLVTIRGVGYLPSYRDIPNTSYADTLSELEKNPLSLLPVEFQLLPSYYILARLPIQIVNKSPEDISIAIDRQKVHAGLWDDGLAQLTDIAQHRQHSGVSDE